MHQKDFIFLARVIRELPPHLRDQAAQLFANRMAPEYPKFRSSTFLSECGISLTEQSAMVTRYLSPQAENKRWGWSYDSSAREGNTSDGQAD